jgi:hypothetical protein
MLIQPLDDVRDYFGEKVALFYVFLCHYTTWCAYLAVAGFGVVLDGFVGSEEYRRVRVVYALYDGKNPCGGALGRSRATRNARTADEGCCSFADQPSLYVCGASKRLRLVMEVQASKEVDGEDFTCIGCCSPEPFSSGQLRSGAWKLPLAKGPWKSDDAWPPAKYKSDVRVRIFHALAPLPPHKVDCIRRGDRYAVWGGTAKDVHVPPAQRAAPAPPPRLPRPSSVRAASSSSSSSSSCPPSSINPPPAFRVDARADVIILGSLMPRPLSRRSEVAPPPPS